MTQCGILWFLPHYSLQAWGSKSPVRHCPTLKCHKTVKTASSGVSYRQAITENADIRVAGTDFGPNSIHSVHFAFVARRHIKRFSRQRGLGYSLYHVCLEFDRGRSFHRREEKIRAIIPVVPLLPDKDFGEILFHSLLSPK